LNVHFLVETSLVSTWTKCLWIWLQPSQWEGQAGQIRSCCWWREHISGSWITIRRSYHWSTLQPPAALTVYEFNNVDLVWMDVKPKH